MTQQLFDKVKAMNIEELDQWLADLEYEAMSDERMRAIDDADSYNRCITHLRQRLQDTDEECALLRAEIEDLNRNQRSKE